MVNTSTTNLNVITENSGDGPSALVSEFELYGAETALKPMLDNALLEPADSVIENILAYSRQPR